MDRFSDWERSGRRRDDDRWRDDWERGGRYRDERAYGYGERETGRRAEQGRGRDERGFLDRAGDEVRSWFGDEEAQRRRLSDDSEYGRERYDAERRWGGGGYGREDVDRDWARQWGHIEGRGMEPRGWGGQERGGGWTGRSGYGGEGYGRERYNREGRDTLGYQGREGQGGYSVWAMWAMGGPHAGRGPRGYQRSDERIKEDVCERMAQHGYLDASEIEVRVIGGEVTLEGTVNDRQAKRVAEDIAEGVSGVRDVHNQIRVAQGTVNQPGQGSPMGQQGQPGQQGWPGDQRNRAA